MAHNFFFIFGFFISDILREHIRATHEQRKFSCPLCNHRSSYKNSELANLKKNSPGKEMYFKKFIFAFFQIWINTSKMFIIISRLLQVPPIISLLLIQFLLLQLPLFWVKKNHSFFFIIFNRSLLYMFIYNIKKIKKNMY